MTIQVILRDFQYTFVSLLSGRNVAGIMFLNDIMQVQVGSNCHLSSDLFFTSTF